MKLSLLPEKPALRHAISVAPYEDYCCEVSQTVTVLLPLKETDALFWEADNLYTGGYMEANNKYVFPPRTSIDDDLFHYEFCIRVGAEYDTGVDDHITVAQMDDYGDVASVGELELSREQRRIIRQILDEDCYVYYGKSCSDLLDEAVKQAETEWS